MSSSKEIKQGIIGTYFIFFLNVVTSLIFTPYLVNSLDKSEYGIYALLGALVSSLMLLDFGFGNAITRYISQYTEEKDKNSEANFLGMCLTIYFFIATASLIVGIIIFFFLDTIYSNFSSKEMYITKVIYILLLFNLFISFFIGAFNAYVQAKEKFRIINVVLLAKLFLRIFILYILLYLGFKAITVVVVDTVLNLITGIFYYLYSKVKLNLKINFKYFNFSFLKEIFSYSSFVFISNVADVMMWKVGLLIIGALQGPTEVALYSLGITIVSYFQYVSGSINGKLFPRITQMITRKVNNVELTNFITRVSRLQFILLGGIVVGFYLYGKEFVSLWLGKDFSDVYWIGLIIMVSMLPQSLQYTCVLVLRAQKKDGFRSVLQLLAMMIGLSIGTFLISRYGSLGMAFGMSFSIVILNWIIVNIHYKKAFEFDIFTYVKENLKMVPLFIIMFFLGMIINEIDYYGWNALILKAVLFIFVYMICLWLIGMNSYEKSLFVSIFNKIFHNEKIKKVS